MCDYDTGLFGVDENWRPPVETNKYAEILNLPFDDNPEHGYSTIKDYLVGLLTTLWDEDESFSGKRPFGNSGWDFDLYPPLITAGLITGELDEWGRVEDCDEKTARTFIARAILQLGEN